VPDVGVAVITKLSNIENLTATLFRQTDRHTDRQTDREADKETYSSVTDL